MSELQLVGATIEANQQKLKDGASSFYTTIACVWSDSFCERFAVQTPSEPYGKSPISKVALSGVNFIMTPSDDTLRSFEIDIACGTLDKFQYVPRFLDDGKVKSRELHFRVSLNGLEGFLKVAEYASRLGAKGAAIKIVYEENAQEEMDFEGGEALDDPREVPEQKKRGRKNVVNIAETEEAQGAVQ